jgi:hypothetical protein
MSASVICSRPVVKTPNAKRFFPLLKTWTAGETTGPSESASERTSWSVRPLAAGKLAASGAG